jgi:para-aminobenzoate synthetase component I
MEIIIKEINADLDPFDIYSVFIEEKNSIFLDSGRDKEKLGSYSYIGVNPFMVVKGSHDKCEVDGVKYQVSVFDKLRELLNIYRADKTSELPFTGGCIGYIAYDLGLQLEEIESTADEDVYLPHYYFVFYDNIIIFNNRDKKAYISACGILQESSASIEALENKIMRAKKVQYGEIEESTAVFHSNFTAQEYMSTVGRVKEYIRSGDIYIANLTQRFTSETKKEAYDIYKALRKINPAPFAAFMQLEGFEVISSSPERFLKVEGGKVETRPIKGTRPRGADIQEDEKNKQELLNSEKDKSELLMIVDLERNDLSKVCKPHSVKVTELFELEEYSTVFHLVATVTGTLKEGEDAVGCMKACFPGGSITGTPKIRAMEIIDELEGLKRSIYTGCIGYFGFNGNADFNIVIRTIVKVENKVYFGVGGGITWDSDEASEYQETLDKAKALMKVI